MFLPEFGVKRPVTNVMIFFAAIVLGLVSLYFLPIDLMPKIEPPVISIIIAYPGASAEDVEAKITRFVENDVSIVPNLSEIISYSRENISTVTCQFDWGTNLDEAANNMRDRLEFTKKKLPEDAQQPQIIKFNTAMIPILGVGVTAKESWEKLYDIVDNEIGDPLKRLPGVGGVQSFSGLEREIHVELNKHKMEAYELTVNEIENALRNNNVTIPAGSFKIGQNDYMVRMPGEFQKIGEIGKTVIRAQQGKIIKLSDVAKVIDSFKELTSKVTLDGEQGMFIIIQKQSGANTVAVTKAVLETLKDIQKKLPKDIKITEVFNTAKFIEDTIGNLSNTILWGGIIVILVTLFFLRNIRGSLIITMTIPFSLIVTFIFVYLFGMSINTMSLASIALAVGMVVDNAIVVLENITHYIDTGKSRKEAAIYGASEVGLAVSASTLTTIVVFIPLIFLHGITGIMFKELGVAITVTLIASLVTALTLTPMLASRLLNPTASYKNNKLFAASENIFNVIEQGYSKVLSWVLGHKALVIISSVIIFVLSLMLVPLIGSEFFPAEDTGDITITVEMPVGRRVEEAAQLGKQIEEIFYELAGNEIKHTYTRSGYSEWGAISGSKEGANVVEVGAKLTSLSERKRKIEDIGQAIRNRISQLPGVSKITMDTGNPMNQMFMGGAKPLTVEIIGYDMETTNRFAAAVHDVMLNTPGASDPTISRDVAKPEILVNVNIDKAAQFGLNKYIIGQTLRNYFYGNNNIKFMADRKESNIMIRLRPEDREFVDNLRDITIPSPTGQSIPLVNVAKIEEGIGSIEIERKNQERVVRVSSNVYGRSLGEVANDVEAGINKLTQPPNITVNMGGMVKEQRKAFGDMGILLLLSILLVYMVLASQFESFIHPFIVMFSVPFAFTGVLVSIWIAGYNLSIITILGAVLLVGIAVNNAIVLIDYINILRRQGLETLPAIKQAGQRRLKPILMTSFTTILGLMPMAFSTGEGSESWRPLGLTIVSGLAIAMFISLILVPVIYSIVNKKTSLIETEK